MHTLWHAGHAYADRTLDSRYIHRPRTGLLVHPGDENGAAVAAAVLVAVVVCGGDGVQTAGQRVDESGESGEQII